MEKACERPTNWMAIFANGKINIIELRNLTTHCATFIKEYLPIGVVFSHPKSTKHKKATNSQQ